MSTEKIFDVRSREWRNFRGKMNKNKENIQENLPLPKEI
jgi:hypothetical protein